ncbi:YrhK family protein [Dietzia sp.]|uniref:YrhK family protein n=1 Tax=Dietzia sp. TaxID=1871616 RepID=UPI002FDB96A3
MAPDQYGNGAQPGNSSGRSERHHAKPSTVELRVGHHELEIRQRYEIASICNDIVIAIWFIVGSILFFSDRTTFAATCLFLIGSIQMILRPAIRLTRRDHLQKLNGAPAHETAMDF